MIDPFAIKPSNAPSIVKPVQAPESRLLDVKISNYNPFDSLIDVKKDKGFFEYQGAVETPISQTISTLGVQEYIKKGYTLTDLDLSPTLEQSLSSTQGRGERFLNNLQVAGANFISSAVGTFLTNPLDLAKSGKSALEDSSITRNIYDWSKDVASENRNFETTNDASNGVWDNLTNWINPAKNSTKGVGKILESALYGLGTAAGIAGQELIIGSITGGVGVIPTLVSGIQKALNSGRYLEEALQLSRIAEQGAMNLQRVVKAGEITSNVAKGLNLAYRSQLGSYSEALFEGLEGKETLKNQLVQDYKNIHGYAPEGKDLEKIETSSTDAGVSRMNINRALLSVTNISQYNSIFKSFDAAKFGAAAAAEKYGSKLTLDATKKEGEKIVYNAGKKLSSPWFDKGVGKFLKPVAETAINLGKIDAIKEGVQEGFEEGLQFFTDKALNNYYTWKHYGEHKGASEAINEATKELFTKEGLESIFTGMLAGGGQSAVTNFLTNLTPEYRQSKKEYEKLQKEYADDYNGLEPKIRELANKYKELPFEIKKKLDNIYNTNSIGGNIALRQQTSNASNGVAEMKLNAADEENFNQSLTHEWFNLALPYARNGNIDILKQQFEEYKNLDDATFQKMFNTTDSETKNKNEVIELYQSEFDNIQNEFKRADNAFQINFKDDISSSVYRDMKHEVAFSLYNNKRLTQTAKELETGVGSGLLDLLYKTVNDVPGAIKDNEEKLKVRYDSNDAGIPENDQFKKEREGLERMQGFLKNLNSNITDKEYLKQINDNLVTPYLEEVGKVNDYTTADKLKQIYYIAKIKDRLKYNQNKLDKLLYSEDPVKFFMNSQEEFVDEVNKRKDAEARRNKNNPPVATQPPVPPATKPPVQIPSQLLGNTQLPPSLPPRNKKGLPPAPLTLEGDQNPIESKEYAAVIITDDKGNILGIKDDQGKMSDASEEAFRKRAEILNQVANGNISIDNFRKDLVFEVQDIITVGKSNYKMEKFEGQEAFYKSHPKRIIRIMYNGVQIGGIPTENNLNVITKAFREKNENNQAVQSLKENLTYIEFLNILNSNQELNSLARVQGFIINSVTVSTQKLIDTTANYSDFINSVLTGDIITEENAEILKEGLDLYAYINDKKGTGRLVELRSIPGMTKDSVNRFSFSIDDQGLFSITDKINNSGTMVEDFEDIKKAVLNINKGRTNIRGNYVYIKQRNKDGMNKTGTIHLISTARRPIEFYYSFLRETVNDQKDLLTLFQNMNFSLIGLDTGNSEFNKVSVVPSLDKGKIKIDFIIQNDKNEQLKKAQESIVIDIDYIGETKGKLTAIIEQAINNNNFNSFKYKNLEIYKGNRTKAESEDDFSNILTKIYYDNNLYQIYSTMYMVIKPKFTIGVLNPTVPNEPTAPLPGAAMSRQQQLQNRNTLPKAKLDPTLFQPPVQPPVQPKPKPPIQPKAQPKPPVQPPVLEPVLSPEEEQNILDKIELDNFLESGNYIIKHENLKTLYNDGSYSIILDRFKLRFPNAFDSNFLFVLEDNNPFLGKNPIPNANTVSSKSQPAALRINSISNIASTLMKNCK